MKTITKFIWLGNYHLPLNLARSNKLEFKIDENDYENMEAKTYEEEKEVTVISLAPTFTSDVVCLKFRFHKIIFPRQLVVALLLEEAVSLKRIWLVPT